MCVLFSSLCECVWSCVRFVLTCGWSALRNDRCVTALHFILSLFPRCHWNNLKLHVFVTVSHWRRRWQPASPATQRKLSLTTEAKEYVGTFTCPSCHFSPQYKSDAKGNCHNSSGAITEVRERNAASAVGVIKHSDYLGRHLSDNRLISFKVIVFILRCQFWLSLSDPDLCC